jgi:uroporphyrinogen decarboxylase
MVREPYSEYNILNRRCVNNILRSLGGGSKINPSFERVWTALSLEIPDRIPTQAFFIDGNVADQILGKPKRSAFDIINELKKAFPNSYVDKLNDILDSIQVTVNSKSIHAAHQIGFDAVGIQYIPFIWEDNDEMTDLFGKRHIVRNIDGNPYPDYYGGYIKNRKDWETYPKYNLEKEYKKAKRFYKGVLRQCKDIADEICIIAQDSLTSVYPPVWQGMGMTNFARALKNDPELIEERFRYTTDYVKTIFKAFRDCGARIFLEAGDIAYSNGPMMHPKYFYKYVLPRYQEVAETVHEWGGKIMFHTDGDINSLLDFIVECKFDGLQCLEPPLVDPDYVKKKIGNMICLSGNIDTRHVLVKGTKQEVVSATKTAINALAPNGGGIISPSNFHPLMSVERLKWMIETVKSHGTYPLKSSN